MNQPDDGLIDGDSAVDLCILDEEEKARHGERPPSPPGPGRGGCLGVLLLVILPTVLAVGFLLL